ncbi:MAG: alpha/beta fold hydrolase [Betaproteobacteria bacterium]|nr:alpha/beta fold hydrolase [Betaproteobacteria bacterium]
MKIAANGIQISYEMEGKGPWLVFSHSLACTAAMWDEQVEAFKDRYTCVRFDTRGHGKSDVPSGGYTLEQMADDLHGLLTGLKITRPHFVGLSMGGMIGMTYALKYPGVLRSLVLCDTTSRVPAEAKPLWADRIKTATQGGMEPLLESTLKRWFTDGYLAQPSPVLEKVRRMILGTPALGYAGCCHAIPRIDTTDRLREIKAPIQIIVGDQDAGTPVAMSRAMHEAAPGSELVIIPSASHLSNLEQPEAFNKALSAFLAKH